MRMLNHFINRAGRSLLRPRRSELESAKSLLSKRIRGRNSGSTRMFQMLYVIAITLVAFAMAPAVTHMLELPGEVRLPKQTYVTMQQI